MPRHHRLATVAEDPSAPRMLRFEKNLPGLPVPTVQSTALKYLETARPHLTKDEYAATERAVDQFIASPLVKELQNRLEQRAARTDNWLADWWDDVAYMSYRDPVVVYVSYFYLHKDSATPVTQAARAAQLLQGTMVFRELVESGALEPDKARDTPMAMSSFKWMFHACRYPAKPADTARKFVWRDHDHAILLHKNRYFVLSLSYDGLRLSTAELEAQIQCVIDSTTEHGVAIGALTSDQRDLWTDAREVLAGNPANAKALEKIESSMVVICLDETSPITRETTSQACWTGDGRNRFYDKHQMIVFANGRSGFLGEHSCMDGTPTLRWNEFVLGALAAGKIDHGKANKFSELPNPEELKFVVTPEIKSLVSASQNRFDDLIRRHRLEVLHYNAYGKELVKTFKISPDAWAQMVKQLAFTKLHGRPGVCYESCSTRKFARGRTEVIRAASNESAAFCTAMLDPSKSDAERADLLRRANVRHAQYAAWAADGQGVDRHLFGLKKLLREGEELPALYKDPAFSRTNHWELSTSQLSSPWIDGWGYGEVVEDGYGLSYAIGDDYFRWTITSLCDDVNALKASLEDAATSMRRVMENAPPPKPVAKL